MKASIVARCRSLTASVESEAARRRAWRAGDATTLYLLEVFAASAVPRRRNSVSVEAPAGRPRMVM